MSMHMLQAILYFLFFFLGVVGNCIVIFVLFRQRSAWSITTTYLFNLAIADLMFVCFLPFWGQYHLNELTWSFGSAMCKATGTMTFLNMYASIFFLTAMSFDRWMAIVHATRMNLRRNVTFSRYACLAVWCVSFVLCIPSMIYRITRPYQNNDCRTTSNNTNGITSDTNLNTSTSNEQGTMKCVFFFPKQDNKKLIMGTFEFLTSILGFILPLCVICFCYFKIVMTVRHKVISKRVRKDRVAKLAALVIGAFFFCWTPFHVVNLYSALGGWWGLFKPDPCFFNDFKPFAVCLAYANSCINPVAYAFTTTNFQENVREMCDKSSRHYRMVLSNPNDGKSPKSPNNHFHLTNLADNKLKQTAQKNKLWQEELPDHSSNSDKAKFNEPQSFSYYSCPPAMQGMNHGDVCSQLDTAVVYSAPENGECSQFLMRTSNA